jgi:hypothetical protein
MKPRFHVILVKPSKYDDDGYVIRWWRGVITSNSLACLNGLTEHVKQTHPLSDRVEIVTHCLDETVQKIPVKRLAQRTTGKGDRAIVCMVGVQTNQFARAHDLSREFIALGIPAMIGGFHVSGVMEMLPEHLPEMKQAVRDGITLVGGEVENRWGELLEAAYDRTLEPVYNFIADKPSLIGVPETVSLAGTPVLMRAGGAHLSVHFAPSLMCKAIRCAAARQMILRSS